MIHSWKSLFLILVIVKYLLSAVVFAAVPSPHWKTVEIEHFKIHFLPENKQIAARTAYISEMIYPQLVERFQWKPLDKISIVINDDVDAANGNATPFPYNKVNLLVFPPDRAGSLDEYDDWLTVLIEHELVHIFHIDKARGKIQKLRDTFGRFILFFPNLFQPAWLIEGLATHVETHKGIGRGQSSSFEMLMRAELLRGLSPVSQINLSPESKPLSRQYLYGVYYYQFLSERYGEAAIQTLIENYSNNILPFAINSNAEEVLGKDISELWNEFTGYLQARFGRQIKILKTEAIHEGEEHFLSPLQQTNIRHLADNSVVFVNNDLESEAMLVRLDENNKIHNLLEVNQLFYFDVMQNSNTVYLSQLDVCDEYKLFYDIYRYEIGSKKLTRLSQCQRYKIIAVNQQTKNLAVVKTVSSIPQIDLLDENGVFKKTLWIGEYGDAINELDWSEENQTLLVSRKRLNKPWSIVEFNLKSNEWKVIKSSHAMHLNAQYAEDNNSILYTSNKSGVHNVYHYNIKTEHEQAITHLLTGGHKPVLGKDKKIYYLKYKADGYRLHAIDKSPVNTVTLKKLDQHQVRYNEQQQKSYEPIFSQFPVYPYSPWPDLKPKYWFPYLSIVDNASEIGFSVASVDSLNHHYYELDFAYGADQQEVVGSFFYSFENWFRFFSSKENSVFQDDAGKTNLIRANTQSQFIFTKPVTSYRDRWAFSLAMMTNNDSDSYRATGINGFGDNNDGLLGISILYDSKRSYLKSHSPEAGRDILLVSESSDVFDSDYSGQLTSLEWREFFSMGAHHVIALRYLRGVSDDTVRPFQLGGSELDYNLDTLLPVVSNRNFFNVREHSLRGYNENTQLGNNIEVYSMEYRFPLQQVERGIMAPPIGLQKHSGRLFYEAGSAWSDNEEKNLIHSAGVEWVLDTNLFYFFNFQMRLGYAKALDEPNDDTIYFSLGSAF